MIRTFLEQCLSAVSNREPALLICVLSSKGSTPRSAGAMMLAGRKGLLAGTIGGGALEYQCLKDAKQFFQSSEGTALCRALGQKDGPFPGYSESRPSLAPASFVRSFLLDNQTAGSLGMVCGGSAEILFTPVLEKKAFSDALSLLDQGKNPCLFLPVSGRRQPWTEDASFLPSFHNREGSSSSRSLRPAVLSQEEGSVLFVPLTPPGRIFLMGGGHVALELSFLLGRLELPHIVIDDRKEFSEPDRFPKALKTVQSSFSPDALSSVLSGDLKPGNQDGFCIMTRGHEHDTDALRFALGTPASYIGVMGSRKKRDVVLAALEAEGFLKARERIITPIGLDISAQTPAQIAVSIAAQLICWKERGL